MCLSCSDCLQFFLHFIYGVRVRASGDRVAFDSPAVIIMNHRTRLDWFYFWLALWRMNPWLMTSNKIALKELLKHVPGAGERMYAECGNTSDLQASGCRPVNTCS